MKNLITLTFSFCLLLINSTIAQLNILPISADYSIFEKTDGKYYLEIYSGCMQQYFSYQPEQDKFVANYAVSVQIFKNDSLVGQDVRERFHHIDKMENIDDSRQFVNTFVFELEAGNYDARVVMIDQNSSKEGKFSLSINLPQNREQNLHASQIQLSSKIQKIDDNNEFTKNGYLILPNPRREFSTALPIIYFYMEIYNLSEHGSYEIIQTIYNVDSDFSRQFLKKSYEKPGTTAVHASGINLVTFNSGDYRLEIIVRDLETDQADTTRTLFKFVNLNKPQPLAENPEEFNQIQSMKDLNIAEYAHMTEEQLDTEFEQINYLLNKQAAEIYYAMEKVEKIRFLASFWKSKDPDPNTEINEFKEDYKQRVEYSKTYFSFQTKPGWKTDRGRVLLMYGRPDEIEKEHMSQNKKPYETWRYNAIQGGVIFIFADLNGFGNFELMHSTMRNEYYQPDWEKYILRTRGVDDDIMDY